MAVTKDLYFEHRAFVAGELRAGIERICLQVCGPGSSVDTTFRQVLSDGTQATQHRHPGTAALATVCDLGRERVSLTLRFGSERRFDGDLAEVIEARVSADSDGFWWVHIDADTADALYQFSKAFQKVLGQYGETTIDQTVLPNVQLRLASAVAFRGRAYRYGGEEFLIMLPNHTSR